MKFPKSDLSEIIGLGKGQFPDWPYEMVEEGGWEHASSKYETNSFVFKFQDKYYEFSMSRSGSPYTDWYSTWDDGSEVGPSKGEIDCAEVFPVIEYKRTFATTPKNVVVLDFGDSVFYKNWLNSGIRNDLNDVFVFYGGKIIE